jgi:hypothetical protein
MDLLLISMQFSLLGFQPIPLDARFLFHEINLQLAPSSFTLIQAQTLIGVPDQ